MNIPEWQSKMIRSSPKSILKHASKHLETFDSTNGGIGTFKEDSKCSNYKSQLVISDDKKHRKANIDSLTGKRKYTKKLLKVDGALIVVVVKTSYKEK